MLKTLFHGKDAGMTHHELKKLTERSKLSNYLPWDVYDAPSKLYFNNDNTFGFIWECQPVVFAGEKTMQTLEGLFRGGLPFGSVVQFILYSDNYIDGLLDDFNRLRVRPNQLFERSSRELCDFLKKGTRGLHNIAGTPVRNYRLFVTLKMPVPKGFLDLIDLDGLAKLINYQDVYSHYTEVLGGADLFPKPLTAQGLIDFMARFFNDRNFEGTTTIPYDDSMSLSDQMILSETVTEDHMDHLTVGNKIFQCVTPKKFPVPQTGVYPMQTNRIFGGYQGVVDDQNQIKTPYLYCLNIVFHDLKNRLRVKSSLISAQRAAGNFVRGLMKKKNEFSEVSDLVESGDTFVRIIPILWVCSDSDAKVRDSANKVKRLWEDNGYTMQQDKGILKPLFISALPFGLYDIEKNVENLERDFITPADRILPILPVQADFAGGGDPVLIFTGRKGQLGTLDFFNKHTTNYNGAIMAGSGGGKSVLCNNIANNYYAIGAIIRIIDIGKSYLKQAKMSKARYMDFNQETDICINPFATIRSIEEDLAVLSDIVLQMIYSSTSSIPETTAETRMTSIKNAIQWAYHDSGKEAEINHIYRYLANFPEHARNFSEENAPSGRAMEEIKSMCHEMAYNLTDFTTVQNGVYGKWFNGKNRQKFDISNDEFVVLELEHLLPKKDLFRVVILQVLNAISQDLYESKRGRRRFGFFDEAAQYLKDEGVGSGFTPIIRMVDAAYRRARKYGGSILGHPSVCYGFSGSRETGDGYRRQRRLQILPEVK